MTLLNFFFWNKILQYHLIQSIHFMNFVADIPKDQKDE